MEWSQLDLLRAVPWWYWLAGLYLLAAFMVDEHQNSYPFDSTLDSIWQAIQSTVMVFIGLISELASFIGILLLWPVLLVWRNAKLNRQRATETGHHKRHLTGDELTKKWLSVKGQRRYAWRWGRFHFMGRWLPQPEGELIVYFDPQHSLLSGHTFVLNLLIASLGITYRKNPSATVMTIMTTGSRNLRSHMTKLEYIRNLTDLADLHGVDYDDCIKGQPVPDALDDDTDPLVKEALRVIQRLSRNVYKYTDCGAWIEIEPDGFRYGSIVEGWDGEGVSGVMLPWGVSTERAKRQLQRIEDVTGKIWPIANADEAGNDQDGNNWGPPEAQDETIADLCIEFDRAEEEDPAT